MNGLCSFGQTRLHWGHVHRSTSRCWQNSGADAGDGSAALTAASRLGRVVVSSFGWFLSVYFVKIRHMRTLDNQNITDKNQRDKQNIYLSYASYLCCCDYSADDCCDCWCFPCCLSAVAADVCVLICQHRFQFLRCWLLRLHSRSIHRCCCCFACSLQPFCLFSDLLFLFFVLLCFCAFRFDPNVFRLE